MTSIAEYENHSVALTDLPRIRVRAGRRDIARAARTCRVIFERRPCPISAVVSHAVGNLMCLGRFEDNDLTYRLTWLGMAQNLMCEHPA